MKLASLLALLLSSSTLLAMEESRFGYNSFVAISRNSFITKTELIRALHASLERNWSGIIDDDVKTELINLARTDQIMEFHQITQHYPVFHQAILKNTQFLTDLVSYGTPTALKYLNIPEDQFNDMIYPVLKNACERGNIPMVQFLIEKKHAKPVHVTSNWFTSKVEFNTFDIAVSKGRWQLAVWLFDNHRQDVITDRSIVLPFMKILVRNDQSGKLEFYLKGNCKLEERVLTDLLSFAVDLDRYKSAMVIWSVLKNGKVFQEINERFGKIYKNICDKFDQKSGDELQAWMNIAASLQHRLPSDYALSINSPVDSIRSEASEFEGDQSMIAVRRVSEKTPEWIFKLFCLKGDVDSASAILRHHETLFSQYCNYELIVVRDMIGDKLMPTPAFKKDSLYKISVIYEVFIEGLRKKNRDLLLMVVPFMSCQFVGPILMEQYVQDIWGKEWATLCLDLQVIWYNEPRSTDDVSKSDDGITFSFFDRPTSDSETAVSDIIIPENISAMTNDKALMALKIALKDDFGADGIIAMYNVLAQGIPSKFVDLNDPEAEEFLEVFHMAVDRAVCEEEWAQLVARMQTHLPLGYLLNTNAAFLFKLGSSPQEIRAIQHVGRTEDPATIFQLAACVNEPVVVVELMNKHGYSWEREFIYEVLGMLHVRYGFEIEMPIQFLAPRSPVTKHVANEPSSDDDDVSFSYFVIVLSYSKLV